MVGHVKPYEDEPFASDEGDNEDEEEEVDADGLTPTDLSHK